MKLKPIFPAHFGANAPMVYHTAAGGNDAPFATAEEAVAGAKANVESFTTRRGLVWTEDYSTCTDDLVIYCAAVPASKNGKFGFGWYGQVAVLKVGGAA